MLGIPKDLIVDKKLCMGSKLLATILWKDSTQIPGDTTPKAYVTKRALMKEMGVTQNSLNRYFRELLDGGWMTSDANLAAIQKYNLSVATEE